MTDTPLGELRDWFDTWAAYVRARDFVAARALFSPGVMGFGTHMRIVHVLDALERDEWRAVWPTITGFTFLTDEIEGGVSTDNTTAWAIVPWSSCGYAEDGTPFDRPGRATVVFNRKSNGEGWRAIHTHFSLAPGTPQKSWGNSDRA